INHPVQELACTIVCDAMVRLSKLAIDETCLHLHPRLNIHDDLTFSIPKALVEDTIPTIAKIMLTPQLKDGIVNVPLSVKVATGENWYEMKEYKKYWSHKDL